MVMAFHPDPAGTVNINVSAANQSVQLYPERGPVAVRVYNSGSATVWITFGDSAVAASTSTSIPVGPGVIEVYTLDNVKAGPLYVAAIAAGATGFVYFTPGRGI